MKPESQAWLALEAHAASLLRPGFAERTLRAAREAAPTLTSQLLFSMATATVCLAVFAFVHTRSTEVETARNLAGWQQFATQSEALCRF